MTPVRISISATVNAPVDKVWTAWTAPEHIVNWNFASDDWHCPKAENDLRVGGKLKSTMAAKDGSFAFDFEGTYTSIEPHKVISYVMPDNRKVDTTFTADGDITHISSVFDAEMENSVEMQQQGWQMILNNFKKYTESI